MAGETSGASRTRKLLYDEYTGSFFFETKVESLERACRQRQEKQDTLNKGEHLKLEYRWKQLENARDIFLHKQDREAYALRHGLKDMVAYRRVLDEVARSNDKIGLDPLYGKYGVNISYFEVTPRLDRAKTRMSPTYRRRKEAERLLQQRRRMQVMDRNVTTPELMISWRKRSHSASANEEPQSAETRVKRSAKLSLPPIQVGKHSASTGGLVCPKGTESIPPADSRPNADSASIERKDVEVPAGEKSSSGKTLPLVQNVDDVTDPPSGSRARSRSESLPRQTQESSLPSIFVTENSRRDSDLEKVDR